MTPRRNPRAARLSRSEPPVETDTPAPDDASATPATDRETHLAQLDHLIATTDDERVKVSAIALAAKMRGISDPPAGNDEGDEDEIVRDATPRDLARAVLATVREYSAQLKDLLGIELVVVYPGETILRTRDPDLASQMGAGEPALTLEEHLAKGSSIAAREPIYSPDGSEIRVGDFTIEFTDHAEQGRSRPISDWVITNSSGAVVGRRLTSTEAVALAQSLSGGTR